MQYDGITEATSGVSSGRCLSFGLHPAGPSGHTGAARAGRRPIKRVLLCGSVSFDAAADDDRCT